MIDEKLIFRLSDIPVPMLAMLIKILIQTAKSLEDNFSYFWRGAAAFPLVPALNRRFPPVPALNRYFPTVPALGSRFSRERGFH